MRRHPALAIFGAAVSSLLLHQSIDSPCSLGSPSDETFAVQLHDDETSSHALPGPTHGPTDYTLRVVIPDIGDDPASSISPHGELGIHVVDRHDIALVAPRFTGLGDCHITSREALDHATWLSLRRDRDVDFVHSCAVTISFTAPAERDARIKATWRADAHAAPPVLLLQAR